MRAKGLTVGELASLLPAADPTSEVEIKLNCCKGVHPIVNVHIEGGLVVLEVSHVADFKKTEKFDIGKIVDEVDQKPQ